MAILGQNRRAWNSGRRREGGKRGRVMRRWRVDLIERWRVVLKERWRADLSKRRWRAHLSQRR
eukprot:3774293-Alexandrium_andersonii.AAC.1